ncbi:hypothetical protein [Saccharopolyspora pogona]|uniref:hypothetical protein n=1 Tax=Saccharopolyspora pogona TaxID=333966 RepID=UPI001CC25B5C|nr:hypothetical protein [Saccharopolyspora pogona]
MTEGIARAQVFCVAYGPAAYCRLEHLPGASGQRAESLCHRFLSEMVGVGGEAAAPRVVAVLRDRSVEGRYGLVALEVYGHPQSVCTNPSELYRVEVQNLPSAT